MIKRIFYIVCFAIIAAYYIGFGSPALNKISHETINEDTYKMMRVDVEKGLESLDKLKKPNLLNSEVKEIERFASNRNEYYINLKTICEIESEIAMNLASAFSMTSRAASKYDEGGFDYEYERAEKEFCRVLRMLNKIN